MSQANTTNVDWQWNIRRVKVAKSQDGLTNVVKAANWSLEAEYIAEDGDQYFEGYADVTEFSDPEENVFVEFSLLSPNTVVEWIKSEESDRMTYIENKILNKINQKIGNEVDTQLPNS